MSVSQMLSSFLHRNHVHYDVVEHEKTQSSLAAADALNIRADRMARAVVVRHEDRFTMCVIPASHHLILEWLEYELRLSFVVASEEDVQALFPDCSLGAIPCIGQAYDLNVILDTALVDKKDIFIEGGDHKHLIHVKHKDFQGLMDDAWQAVISCPVMSESDELLH